MEKDKYRSAITVGMLACSILFLSALFIGCGPCQPTPCTHPHGHQTAYYHYWNPQRLLYKWSLTPRPVDDSIPCPWDTTQFVLPDTVKCNDCDSVLVSRPFTCFHIHRTAHFQCDSCGFTWSHELPPPPNPELQSTPVSVPCPPPENCEQCHKPGVVADFVKCNVCGKTWPPWD